MTVDERIKKLEERVTALERQLAEQPEVINVVVKFVDSKSFQDVLANINTNNLIREDRY